MPGFNTKFEKLVHSDYTDIACSVCLVDFIEGEDLFSTHCFHLFHSVCFNKYWSERRQDVAIAEGNYHWQKKNGEFEGKDIIY